MAAERTIMRRLSRDDNGAIVVFGVFFAVFILGMLYYMIGLGNAIYYRERLQDAADSSAFSAAVIHARGMNTMALINMIMAAVLSVLVTLRLIEGLITVAIGVMLALSWLGGATAGVAAALETVRQPIHNAAEQAEPIVGNVLVVLHQIGEIVRVVVPIGANASVIFDVARRYENVALGVAIPPRLTLPVEDDTYPYLCGKAGIMAGHLAMLPLSPILPSWVEDGMSSAISSLTEAASDWFCGDGEAPSVDLEPRSVNTQQSEEMQRCVDYRPPEGARDETGEGVELCRTAERNDMMATPDETSGLCRVGQVVCLAFEDEDDPSGTYQPREGSYCADDGQTEVLDAQDCPVMSDQGDYVQDQPGGTPYGTRILQARQHCRPGPNSRGYWYLQRTYTVTWEWNATLRVWQRSSERGAQTPVRHGDDSPHTPCGLRPGEEGWNDAQDLSQIVCSTEDDLPPAPPPPALQGPFRVDGGSYVEVTQILGCNERVDPPPVQVEDLDLSFGEGQGEGGGDSGDDQNRNPFRFEEGHLLGTSDMQIRSLVVGHDIRDTEATSFSDHVVGMTRWDYESSGQAEFLNQARRWGQLAVAQAEYYFDGREPLQDEPFARLGNPRDWLWVQGWTARLRRFRLNYDGQNEDGETVNADGGGASQDDDNDQDLLERFGAADLLNDLQPEASDGVGPGTACGMMDGALGDMCSQGDSDMRLFDELFLH